jgi:hypothetical protein
LRREEKRKKKRDVDVFYIRGRGRRRWRRRGMSVVKWDILVFLFGYFTADFTNR